MNSNVENSSSTKPSFDVDELVKKIDAKIAELEKEYDLDRWDIQEIRTEAYRENGWGSDPFPLDEEAEEELEEEWHCRSMAEQLAEVGMSMRDFL